ncbi:MAG TPA: hypothetical protein PKJ41_07615 [Bryobacteraceae bacterium]|nr:hypothetical protein [Bryobacteraceae bacterium]
MNEDAWRIHRSLRLRRNVLPHLALEKLTDACLVAAGGASGQIQTYWCVGAITFSALAVESFLNVAVIHLVSHSEEIVRTASPAAKLAILEALIPFEADRKSAPFNQFADLFKYRNSIAHAKPEAHLVHFVEDHSLPMPASSGSTPLSYWEKHATLGNARRLAKASAEINAFIGTKAGLHFSPTDHSAYQVWLDPS